MWYYFKYVFLFCLITSVFYSQKINQFNKHGERTGKWITYNDSAKKLKSVEGKYWNGRSVGTFYYYTNDGILERSEKNRFRVLKTTAYYPNKNIRARGKAKIKNTPEKIQYYYFGKWKYYDSTQALEKYLYYEKGTLVKTRYVDKSNKTNDSLMYALNAIDHHFNQSNSELLDSIAYSAFNIQKRERLQNELFMSDTLSFIVIQQILKLYGYPTKEKVHGSAVIPFYILNFAPSGIREKYLELFKQAATKGDLDWKSLTFFIDKLKLAKGEKQTYGTQYYYQGRNLIYYPIEDPENLDKRLSEIGLNNKE